MAVMISLACSGVLHFKTVGSGNGVFKGVQGDLVLRKIKIFLQSLFTSGKENFIWKKNLTKFCRSYYKASYICFQLHIFMLK